MHINLHLRDLYPSVDVRCRNTGCNDLKHHCFTYFRMSISRKGTVKSLCTQSVCDRIRGPCMLYDKTTHKSAMLVSQICVTGVAAAVAGNHRDTLFLAERLYDSCNRRLQHLPRKSHPSICWVTSKVFDLSQRFRVNDLTILTRGFIFD